MKPTHCAVGFLWVAVVAVDTVLAGSLVNGDFEDSLNGWTVEGDVSVTVTPANDFAFFEESASGELSRAFQVFDLCGAPGTLSFRYFLGWFPGGVRTGPIPPCLGAGCGEEVQCATDPYPARPQDGSWFLLPPHDSFSAFLFDPVTLERLLPPPGQPPLVFDDFFFADNTGVIDYNGDYVTVSAPDSDGLRTVTLDISTLPAGRNVRLEFGLAGFSDGFTTIAAVDDVVLDFGPLADCNSNGIPDECDIDAGTSADCNTNAVPDECEPDCNTNGRADACDIALGLAAGGRSAAFSRQPSAFSPIADYDVSLDREALLGPDHQGIPSPESAIRNPKSEMARGLSSINLSPSASIGPVGSFHTVTALVTDGGTPVIGSLVTFEALSGPHVGVLGTDVTDPDGAATVSYVGASGEGDDQIVASFFDGAATQFSNSVTRTWLGSLDCNFNAIPDECEGFGAPAATLLGGVSRRVHGGGVGTDGITLNIAGRVEGDNVTSEPRLGGIRELRLAFDIPPGGPGTDPVTIHDQTCPGGAQGDYQFYSGVSTIAAAIEGTDLVLTLSPALANARTYRITVGPTVTGVPCQSIEVRGLAGDASSDGRVNALDRSFVVGVWTGSGYSPNTDINLDGETNATDRSFVVGIWTGSPASACAP